VRQDVAGSGFRVGVSPGRIAAIPATLERDLMTTRTRFFVATVVLVLLAGCGGRSSPGADPAAKSADTSAPAQAAPTKEAVVHLLGDLVAALEAGNHAKAVEYFQLFPGMSRAQAKAAMGTLLEKQEISAAGVEILAERGRFGPLLEIVPDRAEAWAKKAGVDPAKCVALVHEGAEVAVYAGAEGLLLIRCDDVGKLAR